jgi:Ca2+-binding RTX toxin-like protein
MTTVDYSETSISASTLWESFGYLSVISYEETVFSNRSATGFTATYAGYTFVATGKGFKYDADHHVKSGTLDSFAFKLGGLTIESTKIATSIVDLLTAFKSADPNAFRDLFKDIFEGADLIKGSQINDYLEGFKGNDKVNGYDGQDQLFGGGGADTLNGGTDNDSLTGGSGNDHFKFATALNGVNNVDRIMDFKQGSDTIELSNEIFAGIGADGDLAKGRFKVIDFVTSADANDRILYYKTSGDLYYDKDGSGVAAPIKFAHLDGYPTLTASDFLIV